MRHIFTTFLALAVLLSSAGPGRGADSGKSTAGDQQAQLNTEPTFDLSFPGGSLPDLVSALEKAQGKKINVMLPPEARTVVVPKLSLSGIDAETVFRSLNILLNEPTPVGQFGQTGNIWVYQMIQGNKQSRVFFVGHLLSRFSIDDLTTAIQTAWDLEGHHHDGELKFHKETQLLFARATQGQLEAMRSVLEELSKAAGERGNPENRTTATAPPGAGK